MRSFTLVELMIVVAIVGILASIAIPNFHSMQLRAKRAEVDPLIDGIATAAVAYSADHGTWPGAGFQPDSTPGKALRTWAPTGGLATMGWLPDARVRGTYTLSAIVYDDPLCGMGGGYVCTDCLVASGFTDLDEDGVLACAYASRQGASSRNQWLSGPEIF